MHRLRYVGLEAAWQLKICDSYEGGLSACCYGYDSILDRKFRFIDLQWFQKTCVGQVVATKHLTIKTVRNNYHVKNGIPFLNQHIEIC